MTVRLDIGNNSPLSSSLSQYFPLYITILYSTVQYTVHTHLYISGRFTTVSRGRMQTASVPGDPACSTSLVVTKLQTSFHSTLFALPNRLINGRSYECSGPQRQIKYDLTAFKRVTNCPLFTINLGITFCADADVYLYNSSGTGVCPYHCLF